MATITDNLSTQGEWETGTLSDVVWDGVALTLSSGLLDDYATDPIAAGRFAGITGLWSHNATNQNVEQTDTGAVQHFGAQLGDPLIPAVDFEFDLTIEVDSAGRIHAGGFINTVDGQVTGIRVTHLDDGWTISKWVAGVETSITTDIISSGTIAVGQGAHLHIKQDFVSGAGSLTVDTILVATWTNTDFAGGRPGYHSYGSKVAYDNLVNNALYLSSGVRTGVAIDLTPLSLVGSSSISWQETLNGQTVLVETSLSTDNGANWGAWQAVTNGAAIPGITTGMALTGTQVKCRQTLSTADAAATPQIESLILAVREQSIISGVVTQVGAPVARTVRAYRRSDGAFMAATTAAGDGTFALDVTVDDECYVIALDDTADGTDYNAVISDRLIPGH